ncbi:MAG: hypothetical protein R2706_06475 [Acidimicrobiales bacterium]
MFGPATLYVWWSAAWATIMRAFGLASMIYWVDTLGFDAFQLVVLGTGLEAAVFVAEIPTGVVADTRSRKLSLIVSHVVIAIGVTAAGLTGNFWLLVATQVCWGVGWTFKSGADVAWVTDGSVTNKPPTKSWPGPVNGPSLGRSPGSSSVAA